MFVSDAVIACLYNRGPGAAGGLTVLAAAPARMALEEPLGRPGLPHYRVQQLLVTGLFAAVIEAMDRVAPAAKVVAEREWA